MAHINAKPGIDPEIITKLSEGGRLWHAAHADGSDNRINGDVILEAASYGTGFGILAAGAQWIRKTFRNRDKTREDLDAEKEADVINKSCGALEEMLLEYLQAAQAGRIDAEALDELTDQLGEVWEYARSGKLHIPDAKALSEIRGSIAAFTAALAGEEAVPPAPEASAADEFRRIRELLLRQKELLAAGSAE